MVQPFVPAGFVVPESLEHERFRLEPLGPQHNARDHAAWMSSIDHILATPGFGEPDFDWPQAMPLEENLRDLEMHARHFVERVGFTYSVLDADEVIGCVYIYPSSDPFHDAVVRSWVAASRAELDGVLHEVVSVWLRDAWPFSNPSYARRQPAS